MPYIIENGKRINYTLGKDMVVFDDGKEAIPSMDNIDVKSSYKTAKIPTGPVIITPGNSREITAKELSELKDIENVDFIIKPGIITDTVRIHNYKNVSITGAGKVLFQTGRRAIEITGAISGLTLSGFNTKDIQDYQIVMQDAYTLAYNGKEGSFINGITLRDIHSDNCGTLFHSNGALQNGVHLGMIDNFEMYGCSFKNSENPGMVCYLGNARNYNIHHNVVDNVNRSSNVDNGIFMLNGNGRFYSNKVTNHQGRLIRAWLYSHDVTAVVEIFNNIAWNSLKYGPIELQVTPDQQINGFKPANARVYNNTAGRLNTSKDWEGQMLDLYNTFGTVEYFNNLGFEMNKISPDQRNVVAGISTMLNNMSDTKIIRNDGNIYKDTAAEAVVDTSTFKSKFAGVGAQ